MYKNNTLGSEHGDGETRRFFQIETFSKHLKCGGKGRGVFFKNNILGIQEAGSDFLISVVLFLRGVTVIFLCSKIFILEYVAEGSSSLLSIEMFWKVLVTSGAYGGVTDSCFDTALELRVIWDLLLTKAVSVVPPRMNNQSAVDLFPFLPSFLSFCPSHVLNLCDFHRFFARCLLRINGVVSRFFLSLSMLRFELRVVRRL